MPDLAGKTALITGAGRGIGRAIALRFAQAGADLAICARTEAELQETEKLLAPYRRRIVSAQADIAHESSAQEMVKKALSAFGRIDILVNNAGIQGPIGPLVDMPAKDWIQTVQVNLIGTFLMCKTVLPAMIARRNGKIINLSGGGATRPRPFFSAYGASKAAVVRLTETLAHEVKPHNIQVNAIAPGAVYTRMTEEIIQAGPHMTGTPIAQEAKEIKQRQNSADRAAALALFLASDGSNDLTGRLISAIHDDWEKLQVETPKQLSADWWTLRRVDRTLSLK